jgi:hypothetical protein
MADALYHPAHVHRALTRIDAIEDADALLEACGIARGPCAVPPEVHVRILRRCQIAPNAKLERAALRALISRVRQWVDRQFAGLSPTDRQDMLQSLLAVVVEAVAEKTGIDWWECRFFYNLRKAALGHYEKVFDEALKTATADIGDQAEELHDGGVLARDLVESALRHRRLAAVLDPDELALVHPLFLSTLPIRSGKSTLDLERFLGIPEGTLAEKKAGIIRKLKGALQEESSS